MGTKCVLITGSNGLIGSQAVQHFDADGWHVVGIDNNMRREFFGAAGDTNWNLQWLKQNTRQYSHSAIDIRDRSAILNLFREMRFDLVIHCAAQPSHDLAARMPFVDWDVNANGTFNLLEAARQHAPESPFILMSTNKVYGDSPNEIPMVELHTRYDYALAEDQAGITESCRIDRCLHSLFGASKAAADVAAQEFGRYFGMPVGIFRGGCLTGSRHSAVELHGFLSYLVKVGVQGRPYSIFGHKGKQVRDNIHCEDVIAAFREFYRHPRAGEVYNLGGGRENSVSILEAIAKVEQIIDRKIETTYVDQPRRGDHICYISDLGKLRTHFSSWRVTRSIDSMLEEMVAFERSQSRAAS
jgi:CDP-paratose 2-epimerase